MKVIEIPLSILELPSPSILIYIWLKFVAENGTHRISRRELGIELKLSIPTVTKYMKVLEQKDYIKVVYDNKDLRALIHVF
jgi:DNA-binding MarR family transcriptional regulator